MKKLLRNLAEFIYHFHIIILIIIFLSLIASVYLATKLKFDGDLISLLPHNAPAVKTYIENMQDFSLEEHLIIAIESKNGEIQKYYPYIDSLAVRLYNNPLIDYVDYKLLDTKNTKTDFSQNYFFKNLLLYIKPNQLSSFLEHLQKDTMIKQLEANKRLLTFPAIIGIEKLISKDPLRLYIYFDDFLNELKGNTNFNLTEGYYTSQDNSMLLLLIKPIKPAKDIKFSEDLMFTIQHIILQTKEDFKQNHNVSKNYFSDFEIGYTGMYAMVVHDSEIIKRDLHITLCFSAIGLILLFLIAYRGRLIILGLIIISVASGLIWTLAFAYIKIGTFNALTSSCGAILLGLGVDFSIHLLHRFGKEIKEHQNTLLALQNTLSETGLGVITGALTTAGAFYSILIIRFQGLSDLGLTVGTGILLCLLSTIFVLLPLLVLLSKWFKKKNNQLDIMPFPLEKKLEKLSDIIIKYPKKILIIVSIITCGMLYIVISKTHFDSDIRNLRLKDDALKTEEKINERFATSLNYILLITTSDDLENLFQLQDIIKERLDKLQADKIVSHYNSIQTYIPSMKNQKEIILQLESLELDTLALHNDFREALKVVGFKYTKENKNYIKSLISALMVREPLTPFQFKDPNLQKVLKRYFYSGENGDTGVNGRKIYKTATYIHFPITNYKMEEFEAFYITIKERLKSLGDSINFTGPQIVFFEFREIIIKNSIIASIIALILVFIILIIHFRNIGYILLVITPLLLGILFMLGTLALLGTSLNFMNIAVAPMIIGIGIDDGIHILNRYLEKNKYNLRETIIYTGNSIIMTSLTTIIGFGALMLAEFPGVSSIGLVALLGVGFCLLTSVIVLPALIGHFGIILATKNTKKHEEG